MDTGRLEHLLDDYFDGTLGAAGKSELEAMLLEHPAARERFWTHAGWDASLRDWGAEQWGAEHAAGLPPVGKKPRSAVKLRLAIAAAVVAFHALLLGSIWWWSQRQEDAWAVGVVPSAAVLSHCIEARWESGLPNLEPGDVLPDRVLGLESGLASFHMPSGARVSVQGPARWRIIGPNAMVLALGRATASVPEQAQGFFIQTPLGMVVDLGTEFSVGVEKSGSTQAHVFEGKVIVRPSGQPGMEKPLSRGEAVALDPEGGMPVSIPLDRTSFPLPERMMAPALAGGGFESGTRLEFGRPPSVPKLWRGDKCEITSERAGVRPFDGEGMLRFLRTDDGRSGGDSAFNASQLWQLVDLAQVREGGVQPLHVLFRARFNEARSEWNKPHKFEVALVAWRGKAADAKLAWMNALTPPDAVQARASATVEGDADPVTWQSAETTLPVPPEADFMLVCVGAVSREVSPAPFPACFADGVSLEFATVPVPVRATADGR